MDRRLHEDVQARTLALAKDLIARRSITPNDAGCLDVLAARLKAVGFSCERLDRRGIGNLWARKGDARPLVCLAGHVDVVPPGQIEAWASDPFVATERDGFLYGRGTADMKSSVAAMVTALERIATDDGPQAGSIALLLTADEEDAAIDGTAAAVELLRARHVQLDACIVGEPTSTARLGDMMKNGRRGSLSGALTVRGVQCHIAYPERGKNPIHSVAGALADLVSTEWDRGNEHFPPTSFQISNMRAGTGITNIIPGSAEILFNFRFSTASTEATLKQRLSEILDRHGVDYEITWTLVGLPFVTGHGALVQAVADVTRDVTGLEPTLSTTGGTSDGRFLASIAREVVEFGPVNDTIHKVDERIAIADLAPLSLIYEQVLRKLTAIRPIDD